MTKLVVSRGEFCGEGREYDDVEHSAVNSQCSATAPGRKPVVGNTAPLPHEQRPLASLAMQHVDCTYSWAELY